MCIYSIVRKELSNWDGWACYAVTESEARAIAKKEFEYLELCDIDRISKEF